MVLTYLFWVIQGMFHNPSSALVYQSHVLHLAISVYFFLPIFVLMFMSWTFRETQNPFVNLASVSVRHFCHIYHQWVQICEYFYLFNPVISDDCSICCQHLGFICVMSEQYLLQGNFTLKWTSFRSLLHLTSSKFNGIWCCVA